MTSVGNVVIADHHTDLTKVFGQTRKAMAALDSNAGGDDAPIRGLDLRT